MGDQAGGDPSRDMVWLAEGLAEFIRGADARANSSKTNDGELPHLFNNQRLDGNESWDR